VKLRNPIWKVGNIAVFTVIFSILLFTPFLSARSLGSDSQYFEMMMETDHFRIYFHPQDESVAAEMINVAEEVFQKLLEFYGSNPPNITRVFIFHTYEELVSLGNPPPQLTEEDWEKSGGGCFARYGRLGEEVGDHVEAYNPLIGSGPQMRSFLGHEVGHRFFYYAFPHIRFPIRPNWLDEGMAVSTGIKAGGTVLPWFQPIVDSMKEGDPALSGIAELDELQRSGFGKLFNLFYSESATFIFYMAERYGSEALVQCIQEYDRSLSLEGAVAKTFGVPFNQLENDWMNSMREAASQAMDGNDFYARFLLPTTTISLSGSQGNNGWYISEPTLALSSIDRISGVSRTEYSPDGITWTVYVEPFMLRGSSTIYYRSIDNVGNVEATKSIMIKLDRTPPALEIMLLNPIDEANRSTATIAWTGSDSTSGIDHYEVRLDNDTWFFVGSGTSHGFSGLSGNRQVVEVKATDRAGLNNEVSLVLFNLRIISEHGGTSGEGWYAANSIANVSIKALIPMDGVMGLLEGRYVFDGWTGDIASSEPTSSLVMDRPKTIVVQWKADYTFPIIILCVITVVALVVGATRIRRRPLQHP